MQLRLSRLQSLHRLETGLVMTKTSATALPFYLNLKSPAMRPSVLQVTGIMATIWKCLPDGKKCGIPVKMPCRYQPATYPLLWVCTDQSRLSEAADIGQPTWCGLLFT